MKTGASKVPSEDTGFAACYGTRLLRKEISATGPILGKNRKEGSCPGSEWFHLPSAGSWGCFQMVHMQPAENLSGQERGTAPGAPRLFLLSHLAAVEVTPVAHLGDDRCLVLELARQTPECTQHSLKK